MRRTIFLLAILLAASAIQIETYLNADPQDCIEEKCPNQWAICQKDYKCMNALQDCDNECEASFSCYNTCIAKKGNDNAISLWKCFVDNDCINAVQVESTAVATFGDIQQCIEEKCPNQYAACQKDPKCLPALQDCQKKCGTKTSCWTFCLPGKGSQAAIDTAKCASANGCVGMVPSTAVAIATPQQCIETKCRDQLRACSKDSKCFPALQDCEKECGNSTSCFTTCLSKKGNANASNFWKCIVDNDCLNAVQVESTAVATPQQCIEEKCPSQWANCQKDPKCGPALEDCEKKCGTKASCWTLCLPSKGSQAAIDVAKCAQANGCDKAKALAILAGPEECIMKYCKTQEQACVNDRRCINVMDECDSQCNTNFTCWNNCLARRGNKNASDYFKCVVDNKCYEAKEEKSTAVAIFGDIQQCIEEKCPNQWANCQKDPKCVPALQDCQKKCGTKTSCWTLCLPGKGSQAAIDTAKCAQSQGCVGMVPAFESCMMRSCAAEHKNCLANWACRKSVRQCRIEGEWNFDHQCLFDEAKDSGFFSEWYHCAGGHFCI